MRPLYVHPGDSRAIEVEILGGHQRMGLVQPPVGAAVLHTGRWLDAVFVQLLHHASVELFWGHAAPGPEFVSGQRSRNLHL